MAGIASPAKIELSLSQANTILQSLSLLAYPEHKHDKLSYSPTSITLGTNSGWSRKVGGWVAYYSGSEITPDLEALLPLITKVNNCITKNLKILNEISERRACMELIDKAVKGLEALKINQYEGQPKKQGQIDQSIDALKAANAVLEARQAEWRQSGSHTYRQQRLEEEARERAKDERIASLENENRNLRINAAAEVKMKGRSATQLIELSQDCVKLAAEGNMKGLSATQLIELSQECLKLAAAVIKKGSEQQVSLQRSVT